METFATYGSSEVKVTYYQGAAYVVRHDWYPHTTWPRGVQVTRQGHAMYVGIRQGTQPDPCCGGFVVHRHTLPDTEPTYVAW